MVRSATAPHYGGHIGLAALLCMLSLTGCVTLTEQTGSMAFFPTWMKPDVEQTAQRPAVIEAQAVQISAPAATFIVRFADDPELQQVCRNFRRDETGTRAAFRDWAADHAQLRGLHLVRASYSGELILALPSDDPAGRSPADVIAALESMDNLIYAEIDSMASASAER